METFDLRVIPETKGHDYYYEQLQEKYYGQKVYLSVPFSRNEEAGALGEKWDDLLKKWFVFSNSPDLFKIEKHFSHDKF